MRCFILKNACRKYLSLFLTLAFAAAATGTGGLAAAAYGEQENVVLSHDTTDTPDIIDTLDTSDSVDSEDTPDAPFETADCPFNENAEKSPLIGDTNFDGKITASELFSGWNWHAYTFPLSTDASISTE